MAVCLVRMIAHGAAQYDHKIALEPPTGETGTRVEVHLADLPEALEVATYTQEKNTLLIDNSECQGARFLRYQRGSYLQAAREEDVQPETIRKALVGALQHGGWFVMSFNAFETSLDTVFSPEAFPNVEEILQRKSLFKDEVVATLLKPENGDPVIEQFVARDEFKLIFVTDKDPPQDGLKFAVDNFQIIKLKDDNVAKDSEDSTFQADSQLASIFGVNLVKRNSADMVEAAFDGELDVVKDWIEKGYDLESVDGHKNTALGEAAAQGHNAIVSYLIELGGNPNAQNDQGRSPLWRASFNGHDSTVQLLLSSGGDPDLKAQGAEAPTHVAKTEELRTILDAWSREEVVVLKEARAATIRQKMEERLSTAAEREALARDLIRKSLVEHAKNGDIGELTAEIERCVAEAEKEGSRTVRGNAQSRDDRGQTLLMVAAQAGKLDMVKFLLNHANEIEDDPFSEGPSLEQRAFRVEVNARDSKGWTPVSIAAFHGQKDVLKVLLDAGGNPNMPNVYKKNAFQVVETRKDLLGATLQEGNAEILEVLNAWRNDRRKSQLGIDGAQTNSGDNVTDGGEHSTTTPLAETDDVLKNTKKAGGGGKSKSGKKLGGSKPKSKGAPKGVAGSGAKAARALSTSPKKKKPA